MSSFKKFFFIFTLAIATLHHQSTHTIWPLLIPPVIGAASVMYGTVNFFSKHTNAKCFLKKQEEIARYIMHICVYPKVHRIKTSIKHATSFTDILEADTPDVIIEKTLAFAKEKASEGFSVRAQPAVILASGKIYQLKEIRMSYKPEVLEKILTCRFVIPTSGIHFTYKQKLLATSIPVACCLGFYWGVPFILLPLI